MGKLDFPSIKFHHPSSNTFVYINGQKFPSLPDRDKTRTCCFHKDLPEFITSQYTAFSYGTKEEKCILCKNFRVGNDYRDVHVRCEDRFARRDNKLSGSKVLPLKVHSAPTHPTPRTPRRNLVSRKLSPTRHSSLPSRGLYTRDSTPRHSPPSITLYSREKGEHRSVRSALGPDCLSSTRSTSSTFPPLNNELGRAQICRKFTTPVEHYQPLIKLNFLMENIRSAIDPVFLDPAC